MAIQLHKVGLSTGEGIDASHGIQVQGECTPCRHQEQVLRIVESKAAQHDLAQARIDWSTLLRSGFDGQDHQERATAQQSIELLHGRWPIQPAADGQRKAIDRHDSAPWFLPGFKPGAQGSQRRSTRELRLRQRAEHSRRQSVDQWASSIRVFCPGGDHHLRVAGATSHELIQKGGLADARLAVEQHKPFLALPDLQQRG